MLTKYLVTTEVDEDGFIVALCPSLPGCHTQGRTLEEALENIKDAIEIYVEYTDEQAQRCEREMPVATTLKPDPNNQQQNHSPSH